MLVSAMKKADGGVYEHLGVRLSDWSKQDQGSYGVRALGKYGGSSAVCMTGSSSMGLFLEMF